MSTGDMELAKTNTVAPQENGDGAVIEIFDEDEIPHKTEEWGDKNKSSDSNDPDEAAYDDNGDDDDVNNPLGYCHFIVNHHRLAFGITLGAHLFMIVLTVVLLAAGYEVIPINFSTLPLDLKDDATKLRTDAWRYVKDDDAVLKLNGNQKLRGMEYQSFLFVYENKGGNVFTKENLLDLQKFENELFLKSEYQNKLCQLEYTTKNNITNSTCKKPLSVLRFFDGSYKGINAGLYDPTFDKIPSVLHIAQSMNLSKAILNFHLGKDSIVEKNVAESDVTRTLMYTGWPLEGYNSTDDSENKQTDELDKLIVDTFATKMEDSFKDGVGNLKFFYNNAALFTDATIKQVILDMMLAVASFVFIFIFMWFQTGSLWITSWGIFSVVSSFNIANLIYRIVFDYRYFGIFHVLSIFIILGIGSDNIFVFMDSWKQSHNGTFKNLAMRLNTVYKQAAKATLITSFTTMMAFLSNVQSPLLAISSFGLFSAILIIVNYLSVIMFFPTVIMMHHRDRDGRCCCGPMCGRISKNQSQTQSTENLEDVKAKKSISQHVIHFFEGPFFEYVITHKITRWVVIACFTVIIIVSIVFATKLEPDTEQINPWSDDTNWGRVRILSKDAFRPSQEDRVIVVHVVWGLQEQDRSECHHTDFECKGKTVFDKSFDLNPPPCQNAILELCNKFKNLPPEQEEKLKLRRSQVTGEVEIQCIFERMNDYLTVESNKTKYPKGEDFNFPLNSAKMRTLMKYNPRLFNVILPDTYYRFFEVGLGYFITHGGHEDFASSYDYDKYQNMFGGQIDPTSIANAASIQGNKFGNRLLYVAIALNTTLNPVTLGYRDGLVIHDDWEAFVQNEMNAMPSSCNNGFQATVSVGNEWQWLKVQKILVNSAISGIGIGICLALVVLTLATTNIIVGVMATVTIAMVTCGVLGLIPILGWNLGVFESLNLTLVVGLAVDYVVHLADGYMELADKDRTTRVKYTLGHVGISVSSGACTTLGSSIFMLAAKIIFFQQFGIFIFCTIGLSILYSLVLFTTVLAIIGPEGQTGSLRPLMRRIKNYFRGKTKKHTDCKRCKGKGFHKIGLDEHNTSL